MKPLGLKLLWTGLTMMAALTVVMAKLSIDGGDTVSILGAFVMVVGAILFDIDK